MSADITSERVDELSVGQDVLVVETRQTLDGAMRMRTHNGGWVAARSVMRASLAVTGAAELCWEAEANATSGGDPMVTKATLLNAQRLDPGSELIARKLGQTTTT